VYALQGKIVIGPKGLKQLTSLNLTANAMGLATNGFFPAAESGVEIILDQKIDPLQVNAIVMAYASLAQHRLKGLPRLHVVKRQPSDEVSALEQEYDIAIVPDQSRTGYIVF
jgi:hypothetical protein